MSDQPATLHFRVGPDGLIPDPEGDEDDLSGPPVPPEAFAAEERVESAPYIQGNGSTAPAFSEPEPMRMPNVSDDVGWIGDAGQHRYPAKVVRRSGPTLEETPAGGKEVLPVLDLFVFGPEPFGGYRKNVHHVSRVNIREEEHWCFIGRDYL